MQTVLAELRTVAEGIDPLQVETACQMIADAGRIMLYGCGREGLQIQGFAMRLHHLGKLVSMQGDMAAPPMMPGDLFIVSAGPRFCFLPPKRSHRPQKLSITQSL